MKAVVLDDIASALELFSSRRDRVLKAALYTDPRTLSAAAARAHGVAHA
jgi:hypothetical protein